MLIQSIFAVWDNHLRSCAVVQYLVTRKVFFFIFIFLFESTCWEIKKEVAWTSATLADLTPRLSAKKPQTKVLGCGTVTGHGELTLLIPFSLPDHRADDLTLFGVPNKLSLVYQMKSNSGRTELQKFLKLRERVRTRETDF